MVVVHTKVFLTNKCHLPQPQLSNRLLVYETKADSSMEIPTKDSYFRRRSSNQLNTRRCTHLFRWWTWVYCYTPKELNGCMLYLTSMFPILYFMFVVVTLKCCEMCSWVKNSETTKQVQYWLSQQSFHHVLLII